MNSCDVLISDRLGNFLGNEDRSTGLLGCWSGYRELLIQAQCGLPDVAGRKMGIPLHQGLRFEAQEALVNEYIEKNAMKQSEALILTSRKGDASQINEKVREKLKEKGFIGDDNLKVDNGQRTIPLAVGDRVQRLLKSLKT